MLESSTIKPFNGRCYIVIFSTKYNGITIKQKQKDGVEREYGRGFHFSERCFARTLHWYILTLGPYDLFAKCSLKTVATFTAVGAVLQMKTAT